MTAHPEQDGARRIHCQRHLAEDRRGSRSVARLRQGAALVVLPAAITVLLSNPRLPLLWLAIAAILISLAWWRSARKSLLGSSTSGGITLSPGRLEICDGDRTRTLETGHVSRIWVDEERLNVVVERTDGTLFRIEPRYAGVTIEKLARQIGATLGLEPGPSGPMTRTRDP